MIETLHSVFNTLHRACETLCCIRVDLGEIEAWCATLHSVNKTLHSVSETLCWK
ncbi:MAG: hypothetical protein ACT6SG_20460 [Hydrogenophaga sp.]